MTGAHDPSTRPVPPPGDAVDVVVVTYNSAKVIGRLLDSLPAALDPLRFRVVVVDNDSTDGTADLVSRRGDCVVVRAPNLGYAAGINRGVEELAGDAPVLVLNPDLAVSPGAVPRMASALADPAVGIVVPLLREDDGTISRSLRREPTLLRSIGLGESRYPRFSEIVTEPSAYEAAHPCDWATGAAMLVRRRVLDHLGGFDESFFMYSEETELCLRARDAGWITLFAPEARAVHSAGGSGRNPDLYAMQVLNRLRLYRRRHGLTSSLAVWALAALREAAWSVRGRPDARRALSALCLPGRKPALLPWRGSPLAAPDDEPRRLRGR